MLRLQNRFSPPKIRLASASFDLTLVDLRLTNDSDAYDLTGLEVAKFAAERGVPCVIITAFPTVEATRLALRSRGAESLALDVVLKSDGPAALLDAIKVILNSKANLRSSPTQSLQIDLERRLVFYKGANLRLSKHQYALLSLSVSTSWRGV